MVLEKIRRKAGRRKKLDFYQIVSMMAAFFIFGITAAVNHDTYTSVSAVMAIVDGEATEIQGRGRKTYGNFGR